MQVEETIIGILKDTGDTIRENMEAKGINATGRTSLSVRVRKAGTLLELVGGGDSQKWGGRTAPFETIEIGRGPGGDYKKIRPAIYFWTVAKEMDFESDSHRWAVATNIAKGIVEHGTRRFNAHEDVYTTVLREAADKIRSQLFGDVQRIILGAVSSENVITNTNEL